MSWTLRAEETRVARIARQNERVQEARTPTCPPYRRAKNSVAQLSWGAIAAPHNATVAWSITRNSSEATSMAKQHANYHRRRSRCRRLDDRARTRTRWQEGNDTERHMRRAHPSASGCGVRMFGGGLRRIRPWRGALRAAALSQRISSTVPGLVSFKSTVRGSRENLNIKPINCHPCSV